MAMATSKIRRPPASSVSVSTRSIERHAAGAGQQAMVAACRPACSATRACQWLVEPRRGKEAPNSLAAPASAGTSAHKGSEAASTAASACIRACMHGHGRRGRLCELRGHATPRHYGLRHRQAAQPDRQSGVRGERASPSETGRVAAGWPGGLKRGAGAAAKDPGGRARACDSVAGILSDTIRFWPRSLLL